MILFEILECLTQKVDIDRLFIVDLFIFESANAKIRTIRLTIFHSHYTLGSIKKAKYTFPNSHKRHHILPLNVKNSNNRQNKQYYILPK